MFDQKSKRRARLGIAVIALIVAVILAFRVPWASGWTFAVALYYLHLNTEHSN